MIQLRSNNRIDLKYEFIHEKLKPGKDAKDLNDPHTHYQPPRYTQKSPSLLVCLNNQTRIVYDFRG